MDVHRIPVMLWGLVFIRSFHSVARDQSWAIILLTTSQYGRTRWRWIWWVPQPYSTGHVVGSTCSLKHRHTYEIMKLLRTRTACTSARRLCCRSATKKDSLKYEKEEKEKHNRYMEHIERGREETNLSRVPIVATVIKNDLVPSRRVKGSTERVREMQLCCI